MHYHPLEGKHCLLIKSQKIFQYYTSVFIHSYTKEIDGFLLCLTKQMLKYDNSLDPIMFHHIQSCQLLYFTMNIPTVTLKKKKDLMTLLPYQSP